jgi:hypothetical protein
VAFPGNPSLLFSFGIAALIAWRVYSRVRRMMGRQRLSRVRPWISVTLFPMLIALLLLVSIPHPLNALAVAGGAGLGVALGIYGIRLTKFEPTSEGLFYTPNAHLGIALSLLFVARIVYRLVQMYWLQGTSGDSAASFIHSPLTLLIFGTLAGYYVAYAVGLLRWRGSATSSLGHSSVDGAMADASGADIDGSRSQT